MNNPIITVNSPESPLDRFEWDHSREFTDQDSGLKYLDRSIYSTCRAVLRIELKRPTKGMIAIAVGISEDNTIQPISRWTGVYSENPSEFVWDFGSQRASLVVRKLMSNAGEDERQTSLLAEIEFDPSDPVKWLAVKFRKFKGKEKRKVLDFLVKDPHPEVLSSLKSVIVASPRKSDKIIYGLLKSFDDRISKIKSDEKRKNSDLFAELSAEVPPEDKGLRELARLLNSRAPRHKQP